jgi:hypothetical protein
MSLINEALKKAQRVRHEDGAAPEGAATPAGGIVKRGKTHSANTMVLLGSGALVLVVLSVVVTVFLVNRPSKTIAHAGTAVTAPDGIDKSPSTGTASESSAPIVLSPAFTAPASTAPADPIVATPAIATETPDSSKQPAATEPAATAKSAAVTPVPAATNPTPPSAGPAGPDERVAAFVEAVRVMGIRSSGAESRVLMNERVYRVNDIVERTLGVRLIKVAADALTFSDANGVTYVKNF